MTRGKASGLSPIFVCPPLFTCVNIRVFLHVRLLVEAFAAEVAGVGPGVGVDEEVGGEGAAPLKRLPTLRALNVQQLFMFPIV